MSFWSAVVLMVLIGAVASVLRSRYNAQNGYASDRHGNPIESDRSAREAELEHEVKQLRDRIHVLERIATDDRQARQISDEIERLRDE